MANDDTRPSKTRQKKDMLALQALGAELVALNESQLDSVPLPETLRDAIEEARRITSFEARRRQLQYIGKLMRSVDPGPIRDRLDAWKATSREHTARLHRIERWRERLLSEEPAFAQFVHEHPWADSQRLRLLIRHCRRERAEQRPPRNYRALFQLIRTTLEQNAKEPENHESHR